MIWIPFQSLQLYGLKYFSFRTILARERERLKAEMKSLKLRGPSGSFWSSALLQQEHLNLLALAHVQVTSEDLQEDSTASLGSLCSINCNVQKCCLVFRGNLLCSVCAHCLCTLPSSIYTHSLGPPKPPLLQAEESQLSQLLLTGEMLLSLKCLHDCMLNSFRYVSTLLQVIQL